jgi:hypothetical protein
MMVEGQIGRENIILSFSPRLRVRAGFGQRSDAVDLSEPFILLTAEQKFYIIGLRTFPIALLAIRQRWESDARR